jgi:hypothetical protein
MMSYGEHGRRQKSGWDDLDALVVEEMEALGVHPRERRRASQAPPAAKSANPRAPGRYREAADGADDDEETFIERTVYYLRERPDAEALLEAIRAGLHDEDGRPLDDAGARVGEIIPQDTPVEKPVTPDATV